MIGENGGPHLNLVDQCDGAGLYETAAIGASRNKARRPLRQGIRTVLKGRETSEPDPTPTFRSSPPPQEHARQGGTESHDISGRLTLYFNNHEKMQLTLLFGSTKDRQNYRMTGFCFL
jgi:hypothetical protein